MSDESQLPSSPDTTFSHDAVEYGNSNINDQPQQHNAAADHSGLQSHSHPYTPPAPSATPPLQSQWHAPPPSSMHLDTTAGGFLLSQPSAYRANSYSSDSDVEQKETFDTLDHFHLGDDHNYSPRAELQIGGGSHSSGLFPSSGEEAAHGINDSQSQRPQVTPAQAIQPTPAVIVQPGSEGPPVTLMGAHAPRPPRGTPEYSAMERVRKRLFRKRVRELRERGRRWFFRHSTLEFQRTLFREYIAACGEPMVEEKRDNGNPL